MENHKVARMTSENEKDIEGKNSERSDKFLTFKLGDEEFGADVMQIKEISKMKEITRVPTAPSFIKGVINLRGSVTPVFELREKLGMKTKATESENKIVIAEQNEQFIGMIVEQITDVLEIPNENIDSTPDLIAEKVSREYLKGVGKVGEDRLVVILDLEKVLSEENRS